MHRWLLSGLTCAAAVLLYAPYTYVHAQELPVRPGLIAAQLDSNKAVYHVGEPIMLRLTLINRTSQKIDFAHGAPYYMSDLEVVDTEGKVVSATIGRGPCWCQGTISSVRLDRGRPVVVEYNDPRITEREGLGYAVGALRAWADIKDWGYVLQQPGTYTIVASLSKVAAIIPGGPEFSTSPSDKSNAVHLTIIR
jgi:hypothetical protein